MRLTNIRTVLLLAGAALTLLTGCNQKPETFGSSESRTIALAADADAAGGSPAQQRSDTLAYEHDISIELDREVLPARLKEIESACVAGKPVECTVLEVTLNGQDEVFSGTIRMRLAPQGVDPTIEAAGQGGKLTSRSTTAEDLAQPIADTQRRLALMTTHRDRLAEFMKSKDIKVEQLIAVSKELATVQTEIDTLSTNQAQLRRRIDTHLLTINLSPPRSDYAAQRTPIGDALKFFGSNFRDAVGEVINFIAVLLPWLVILLPGLFLLRAFWSWIGRTLARRQQRKEAAA